jgi:6-phosphogluconolactonase
LPDPIVTRRDFLKAASLLAAPVAYPCAANAGAGTDAPPPAAHSYAYVGTYTPNGGGIYLFRVDGASGALTQLQVFDDIRAP